MHGFGHLLIVWHDSHLTGIKILDEQHRAYVSLINSLHYTLSARRDDGVDVHPPSQRPAFLQSFYDMLISHSKIHFKTEIELLRVSDYPHLYEHQHLHGQFITDADQIFQKCMTGDSAPELFMSFLKDFWQKHILQKDKAYCDHLIDYFKSKARIIKKR